MSMQNVVITKELPRQIAGRGPSGTGGLPARHLDYPTIEDLRRKARRRVPKFAFEFVDAGCGDDVSLRENRVGFDRIKITPRYGKALASPSTEVELFGRRYAMPLGVAPMGLGGMIWPGTELHIARAAQKHGIPYVLATPACASIEEIAPLVPDVFWFQLYAAPANDFRLSLDLMARAERAGAHVLVVTIDSPVRGKRPKDMRNRLSTPFRMLPKTMWDIATSPSWAIRTALRGAPMCRSFLPYAQGDQSANAIAAVVQRELRGSFSWEQIRRLRDLWPRALVVKGILHPGDAELAVAVGADGVIVSTHGGRVLDAAPSAISTLPGVVSAVEGRCTVMMDSGVRTGLDIVRALSQKATAVFAGRPFLYGVAALGAEGPAHVAELFNEELQMAMGQLGLSDIRAISTLADG